MPPKEFIICFGGGKDSLALLHFMRPELDRALVMFGDTGMVYPHMRDFVIDHCRSLKVELQIVTPGIDPYQFLVEQGVPTDIVPVDQTAEMIPLLNYSPGPAIQSRMTCCSRLLWQPVYNAILKSGIRVVYRGARKDDRKRGVMPGYTSAEGITFEAPLWDWSEQDVFDFLAGKGVQLPAHYREVNTSFDCFGCSAYLNDKGAKGRIAYTKKHYPHLWPILEQNLDIVREGVTNALLDIRSPLEFPELP